jgi:hypothetical protein
MNDFRQIAIEIASLIQSKLTILDKDYTPMDEIQTEEMALMIEEELNELNGNI